MEYRAGAEQTLSRSLPLPLWSAYQHHVRNLPRNTLTVVATFAARELATACADVLRSDGFHSYLLTQREIEDTSAYHVVRSFALGSERLLCRSVTGEQLEVSYRDVELLVRGTRTASDPPRWRPVRRIVRVHTHERRSLAREREGFLHVYSRHAPVMVLRERLLAFHALGVALKPARAANFTTAVTTLQQRTTHAATDGRLLTRRNQALLLGPMLSPEEHLHIGTSLLAKVFRTAGHGPYR